MMGRFPFLTCLYPIVLFIHVSDTFRELIAFLLHTKWLSLPHNSMQQPELRFCAGSNPARGVPEIYDGENLWQWSRLEIRLNAFYRQPFHKSNHHHDPVPIKNSVKRYKKPTCFKRKPLLKLGENKL